MAIPRTDRIYSKYTHHGLSLASTVVTSTNDRVIEISEMLQYNYQIKHSAKVILDEQNACDIARAILRHFNEEL